MKGREVYNHNNNNWWSALCASFQSASPSQETLHPWLEYHRNRERKVDREKRGRPLFLQTQLPFLLFGLFNVKKKLLFLLMLNYQRGFVSFFHTCCSIVCLRPTDSSRRRRTSWRLKKMNDFLLVLFSFALFVLLIVVVVSIQGFYFFEASRNLFLLQLQSVYLSSISFSFRFLLVLILSVDHLLCCRQKSNRTQTTRMSVLFYSFHLCNSSNECLFWTS